MIKLTDILNEAENPCWKGYKQVGMKSKNGKEVPNCVPESVEVNESQLKETMIRRAVDLAQEILPKNTWSRYASNGPKNREFVKSIVRDLTNMLNRFYKSYDVDVRIKEEVIKEVGSWRIDHYTGKSPGRLTPTDFATVKNDKDREKKRAMEKDLAYHLNTFWKRWKVPFRIDLSKTQR